MSKSWSNTASMGKTCSRIVAREVSFSYSDFLGSFLCVSEGLDIVVNDIDYYWLFEFHSSISKFLFEYQFQN